MHQGAKLPESEQPAFFSWLTDLEFDKMGLPQPDLVIYLDVDLELSLERMKRRQEKTHTVGDIHETDEEYLRLCLETADRACGHFGWTRVGCRNPDGTERDIDEKSLEVYDLVMRAL